MNGQRLRTVFGVDLGFNARRPMTWVLILLVALMSFGLSAGNVSIQSGDSTVGGDSKAWITSEFAIGMIFPVVTFMFYMFFIAIAAGMAVPRDDELRIGPVLHSTSLRPSEYVWGKFSAVLVTFLAVLVLHLLFQMFFNHLWPHADEAKVRGPLLLAAYLRPAIYLALPCLVFFAGASFAIGEMTRKPILVFVMPVVVFLACLFFLFDWSPDWLDPRINRMLMWIEPSGFRWINETWLKLDRGIEFYNTQPVGYDAPFLLSRVAYVLAGLGLVGVSSRHFERSLRGEVAARRRKRDAETAPDTTGAAIPRVTPLGELRMKAKVPGFLKTVADVARFEARNLAGQPGLYLFVPIIVVRAIMGLTLAVGPFDTRLLATSGTAAVGMMNSLTLMVCLLLMFYTVESVLREKNTGLAQIFYATPSRTAAMLLGKAIANGIVGVVILIGALLGAAIVLLMQGKVALDLAPFGQVWVLALFPTFLVWAAFITALVAITGSRYTTYAVALATLIFTGWKQVQGEMNWVGNWNLWSALTWTDFGGLDPNGWPLLLNRLFYLAVAAFLIALTVRIFPRREHDSGATLDRLRPVSLLKAALRLSPVIVPAAAVGTVLWVQVGQGFQGEAAEKRAQNYWGRNVKTWDEARTPTLGGVDLDLELDPAAHRVVVSGSYDLVNPTEEPMPRFPMSIGDHFENVEWTLDGEEFTPEDRAKLLVFDLEEPLAPGDTVRVGFSHEAEFPRGITKNGGGMGTFVLPSGVVLTAFDTGFLPLPLFEEERGVDEDNATEPKDWDDDFHEGVTAPGLSTGVRYPVRTRIKGPAEYRYHAVGVLRDETVEDGVRTMEWSTDAPVNFFNVVAAKWDVRKGEGVEIWHHPDHTYNLDEMMEALEASRKYYSEWFYPYPWQDLRVNEFPGLSDYAQGFPTNITFSESIGFLTRNDQDATATFMVTAHEAAHQWWGNILMCGEGPGGNILVEGTAHFSTILLYDQVKGAKERMAFCRRIEENYGDSRQVDSEGPLVKILGDKAGDNTVTYDKGGWVFWMLYDLMGREACLSGLHDFIERYRSGPDFPVLQDFVNVMREHAPDPAAYDAFTDQWFFRVVAPEYRFSDARKEENGDGWTVTARIENAGTGRMPVDVAAVRGERFPEEGESDAEPWREARETVVLEAGESADLRVVCDFEPEELVVDPDVKVLMLERKKALARL
ncbi:MAG TPA: M1 family aminopeptidase [bacterium]|nr:M1 family aminopeptidase [bacterium]